MEAVGVASPTEAFSLRRTNVELILGQCDVSCHTGMTCALDKHRYVRILWSKLLSRSLASTQ